jgi:hypothetical protein
MDQCQHTKMHLGEVQVEITLPEIPLQSQINLEQAVVGNVEEGRVGALAKAHNTF